MLKLLNYLSIIVFFAACDRNVENMDDLDSDSTFTLTEKAEVKVQVVHYTSFSKEIISNGKLTAYRKADLQFRTSENISKIFIKNGERVSKGQLIACLDNFSLKNTLNQSMEQFERAKLDLTDLLIGQGYNIADSSTIQKDIMAAAKIKSGYDRAQNELNLARYNLNNSELRSPFDGLMTDLKLQENNLCNVSEKFCSVIDDSRFEAEFAVLENEFSGLHKGQSVRIIPYAKANYEVHGEISQINPVIDNNGMLRVKAIFVNKEKLLVEGMNVKVYVEEKVSKKLVVPKGALVLRSGKQVIFTLENSLAKWNYVKTEMENSSSFVISEGLKDGDTVIVEGNLNLAHDSRISVLK